MMRISVSMMGRVCLLAAGGAALSGCILLAGGAAVGGAIVASDRRSSGTQLEDAEIESRVNAKLNERFERKSVRIDVTSYDRHVLLAGQVPQEKDRRDAAALAAASENVSQVTNELELGSLVALTDSPTDDVVLCTRVRATLLGTKGLPNGIIKTSCTMGSIYLFGKVSAQEADAAKQASSRVSGVKRVVVLFEILPPEQLAQPAAPKS